MNEPTQCPTCKGGGKVDSKDGKSWAEITKKPNPGVRSGEIQPHKCPTCRGRGVVEQKQAQEAAQDTLPVETPEEEETPTTGQPEPNPEPQAEDKPKTN